MTGFDGIKTEELVEIKRILEIKPLAITMKSFGGNNRNRKHDWLPHAVRVIHDDLLGTDPVRRKKNKKMVIRKISKELVRRTK